MPINAEQAQALLNRAITDKGFRELLLLQPDEAASMLGIQLTQQDKDFLSQKAEDIKAAAARMDAAAKAETQAFLILPALIPTE